MHLWLNSSNYTYLLDYITASTAIASDPMYGDNCGRSRKTILADTMQKIPAIDLLRRQFVSKMTWNTVTSCFAQVRFKGNDGSGFYISSAILLSSSKNIRPVPLRVRRLATSLSSDCAISENLNMHAFRNTCAPISKESILPVHRLYSWIAVYQIT